MLTENTSQVWGLLLNKPNKSGNLLTVRINASLKEIQESELKIGFFFI